MPSLAYVRLNERAQPVPCDARDVEIRTWDFCVIENAEGREETGYVSSFLHLSPEQMAHLDPCKVVRRAESRDVRAWHFLMRREADAIEVCKEKVLRHDLDMKITDLKFQDHLRKVVFYFTSDHRVDFRELVKDLAAHFRARIELWQIGVRDEAKRKGGYGVCGCPLCCCAWMREFAPVSIRYAKAQNLQFSPSKLSGSCGRLRCCLGYEQEQYVEMSKGAPRIGALIETSEHGEVKVVDRNLITQTLTVTDGEGQTHSIDIAAVSRVKQEEGDEDEAIKWQLDDDDESEENVAALFEEEEPNAITAYTKGGGSPDRGNKSNGTNRSGRKGKETASERRGGANGRGRRDSGGSRDSRDSKDDKSQKNRRQRGGKPASQKRDSENKSGGGRSGNGGRSNRGNGGRGKPSSGRRKGDRGRDSMKAPTSSKSQD